MIEPYSTGNVGYYPLRSDKIYHLSAGASTYAAIGSLTTTGNSVGFLAIGYFTPPTTGYYNFILTTDQTSTQGVYGIFWIGDLAKASTGRTRTNADIWCGDGSDSYIVSLTQGVKYPIRMCYSQCNYQTNFNFSWLGPGIAETTDLSQYFSTYKSGTAYLFEGDNPETTYPGQYEYTGSLVNGSTRTWICPPYVTSVSVLCIGAGGGGVITTSGGGGGGGGGLSYLNNIAVTPGTTYTIKVHPGGKAYAGAYNDPAFYDAQTDPQGYTSAFQLGVSTILRAYGGDPPYTASDLSVTKLTGGLGGLGGPSLGYNGGNGGNGGNGSSSYGGGGGGAGGYSGNGGIGGSASTSGAGGCTAGAGGGGGGGARCSSISYGQGGGTGSQGTSYRAVNNPNDPNGLAAGALDYSGGGGSGGTITDNANVRNSAYGGVYGGGGSGGQTTFPDPNNNRAGDGVVRIIWGVSPYTDPYNRGYQGTSAVSV